MIPPVTKPIILQGNNLHFRLKNLHFRCPPQSADVSIIREKLGHHTQLRFNETLGTVGLIVGEVTVGIWAHV